MGIIGTFIGRKGLWNAQASVSRARQVFVNALTIRTDGNWAYGGCANGMPRNRAV